MTKKKELDPDFSQPRTELKEQHTAVAGKVNNTPSAAICKINLRPR
jgi:hypothetical protein